MSDLKEAGGRGRGTKRKLEEKVPGGKKSKGELSTPPLPSNGYPKVKQLLMNFLEDSMLHLCNNPGAPIQPRWLSVRACRARSPRAL